MISRIHTGSVFCNFAHRKEVQVYHSKQKTRSSINDLPRLVIDKSLKQIKSTIGLLNQHRDIKENEFQHIRSGKERLKNELEWTKISIRALEDLWKKHPSSPEEVLDGHYRQIADIHNNFCNRQSRNLDELSRKIVIYSEISSQINHLLDKGERIHSFWYPEIEKIEEEKKENLKKALKQDLREIDEVIKEWKNYIEIKVLPFTEEYTYSNLLKDLALVHQKHKLIFHLDREMSKLDCDGTTIVFDQGEITLPLTQIEPNSEEDWDYLTALETQVVPPGEKPTEQKRYVDRRTVKTAVFTERNFSDQLIQHIELIKKEEKDKERKMNMLRRLNLKKKPNQ